MNEVIVYIGEDRFPVTVKFEYQEYQPAEEIDGLINPEIEPAVDIKSISFGGFALDTILNEVTVKAVRKQALEYMIRVAVKFTDFPEININGVKDND